MKIKFILCPIFIFGICFVSNLAHALGAPPPAPEADLPGRNQHKIETYWVAPYVRVSEGFGGAWVTWFDETGRVKRQVEADSIEPGFIDTVGKRETILGVNEDWKITLPPVSPNTDPHYDMSGYITSTPDSRVFIHEFHPRGGMVSLDIYIHGKLVHTVGTFVQHGGDEVNLNDDGSGSLLVWQNESKTNAQMLIFDTNGNIVTPQETHSAPMPDIGPNPFCMGQIPGTRKALFWTSLGYETNRYHLIDQNSGKQLWDIPCPGGANALTIGLTPKFIIFAVAELYKPGPWRGSGWIFDNNGKEWIRTFYAINVEDGKIVARWQEGYPRQYNDADRDNFLLLKNKLYFVTSDEFTELNFDDIVSKRNGWK